MVFKAIHTKIEFAYQTGGVSDDNKKHLTLCAISCACYSNTNTFHFTAHNIIE